MGMERASLTEDKQVLAPLGVGELHLVASGEWSAALSGHARQGSGAAERCGPLMVSAARLRALWGAAFPRRSFLAPQSRRRRAPPARSGASEGVVQVAGRQNSVHLAGGLDEQVLG